MPSGKDVFFYAIPGAIAVVAGVLAYRAFRDRPWEPPKDSPELVALSPCGAGHYRCRDGKVQVTTGEERDAGLDRCVFREVQTCKFVCASDGIVLTGVDDKTAKAQLCDPPNDLSTLISEEKSYLDGLVTEAGVCEGDGYIPTPDSIEQCILKSGKDPNATGVVFGRIKCRRGVVPTADRTPRLVSRAAAVSVWCKRDPAAVPEAPVDGGANLGADAGDAGDADAGDATDASTDADVSG